MSPSFNDADFDSSPYAKSRNLIAPPSKPFAQLPIDEATNQSARNRHARRSSREHATGTYFRPCGLRGRARPVPPTTQASNHLFERAQRPDAYDVPRRLRLDRHRLFGEWIDALAPL